MGNQCKSANSNRHQHQANRNQHIVSRTNTNTNTNNQSNPNENNLNFDFSLWKDIRSFYKFGQVIGTGGFAEVRICKKRDDLSNKIFAAKSIYKPAIKPDKMAQLINEIKLLTSLDHPNIIKFFESYQDEYYLHIIMEHCSGGELFDKIVQYKNFGEYDVSKIIWNLLSAISYCHSKGVIHRDLKPENILLDSLEDDYHGIKLIDFGLSKKFESDKKLSTVLGTPYYIAPEVLKGSYDAKCDVWSIGVIAYTICSGALPFYDKANENDNYKTFQLILTKEPGFEAEVWKTISSDAIDFIRKCLVKDPEKRLSSDEAINHPWFEHQREKKKEGKHLCFQSLINLKDFSHVETFKKLVIKSILSNFLSLDELRRMRRIFQTMDLDHTGYINASELQEAFKKGNIEISDEELNSIIKNCDDKGNGKLDYSEFLVGSLDPNYYINRQILEKAFKYFDVDDSGFICTEDINNVLIRSGEKSKQLEDLKLIIHEVGKGKTKLSLEDFMAIFDINTEEMHFDEEKKNETESESKDTKEITETEQDKKITEKSDQEIVKSNEDKEVNKDN